MKSSTQSKTTQKTTYLKKLNKKDIACQLIITRLIKRYLAVDTKMIDEAQDELYKLTVDAIADIKAVYNVK